MSEQEKRNQVLLAAYKIHTTKTRHIHIDELGEASGVGREVWQIIRYLGENGKGWLKKSGNIVRFTVEGLEEAEEMQNQRFEDKERLVLETLYNARKDHPNGVNPFELATALNMDVTEVQEIVVELERKGWADGGDENTWIIPAGIKEIEKKPEPPTPHIVINNPQNSPMSFGPNSTQTVTYNNQNVQDILPQLSQLIQGLYDLKFETRGDVISELQKVEVLAKGEMNEKKWELIQSRLITAKTALEVGKIASATLPYWPAVWNFFFKLVN
jgi:hypothetical protein